MIYLASDHAGFELKEKLKSWLQGLGYAVKDMGAFKLKPDDDYPDFIRLAAEAVSKDPQNARAIIFGFSGQGEAMAANRFKGVRAAVYYGLNEEIVKLSREHNNVNVLSLGAGFLGEAEAKEAVRIWLETKFTEEERHLRRINKIDSS